MLELLQPLTPHQWDAIDSLCMGYDAPPTDEVTKHARRLYRMHLREAANRIPGHRHHSARERILFWRAKQIGVAEYLAGLRDDDGFPIVPRDIPPEHPASHQHDALFPE